MVPFLYTIEFGFFRCKGCAFYCDLFAPDRSYYDLFASAPRTTRNLGGFPTAWYVFTKKGIKGAIRSKKVVLKNAPFTTRPRFVHGGYSIVVLMKAYFVFGRSLSFTRVFHANKSLKNETETISGWDRSVTGMKPVWKWKKKRIETRPKHNSQRIMPSRPFNGFHD